MAGTPYAARCAHHTHRHEAGWQLRAYTTTALTTRCRCAVLVFPDPDYNSNITMDLAWNAVTNGMGMMISTTSQETQSRPFHVRTATSTYSNTLPAAGTSTLGHAAGVLVIVVLQPPLGTTEAPSVNLRVMARVNLQVLNPIPGFGLWESEVLSHPSHPQTPPDWTLGIRPGFINAVSNNMLNPDGAWLSWAISHTGNIPLAGGIYFIFPQGTPGRRPQFQKTQNNGDGFGNKDSVATVYGNLESGTVYMCSKGMPPWQNNRSIMLSPKYFAVIRGAITHHVYMIGFLSETDAANQTEARYAAIGAGAELALRYRDPPKWTECFPIGVPTTTATSGDGSGSLQTDVYIDMWAVYRSGYRAAVYTENNNRPADVPYALTTTTSVLSTRMTALPTGELDVSRATDDDPGEGPSGVGPTPNYTPPPPTAPDWDSDSSSEDDDCCPEHMYDGVLEQDPQTMTPDELNRRYAMALQAVEELEMEARRRHGDERRDVSTSTADHAYARGSFWDLLRDALRRRRGFLG